MSRGPLRMLIVVALLVAVAIWLGYAYRGLQSDSGLVPANDRTWFLGIVLIGCAIDALVAARVAQARVGPGSLVWIALRSLMSLVGFLFLTFPLYAVAFVALTRAARLDPRTNPSQPHAYRPISAGWFGALTPVWWSRTLAGANQITASRCAVCREDVNDPIHGPAG